MLSFGSYVLESNNFTGVVFHGTNTRFDKFDQRQSRIINDNYGGGVAYDIEITKRQSIKAKT